MTAESFIDEYGWVVMAALRTYIEEMRKAAAALMADYDKIKDDPDKRAAQDETMFTTMGLKHIAGTLTESADTADRAMDAWQDLMEDEDE